MMKKLWEILVPVAYNGVGTVRKKHHRKWDAKVSKIAGGLTIFKPKKGQWFSENKLFKDLMIPVRIAATEKEIKLIAKLTAKHYEQKAIMYYLISDKVVISEY